MLRKILAVPLALVSLFGVVLVCAAIGDLVGGDGKTGPGMLVGLLVFFGGITAGTGWGALRLWRGGGFRPEAHEARVLQLARENGGRLSVADVSIGLSLPLKQAQLCLDHLAREGAAEHLVSDDGTVLYGIRSAGLLDKASAERV